MTAPEVALLITVLMFSIYGIFCGIECGISLVRLWPGLSSRPSQQINRFLPLWEITNVFLVFGFTIFTNMFNNKLVIISQALLPILIVGFVALLVRPSLVLYLFYAKQPRALQALNVLFALACFAIPLSFVASGVYLIGGHYFWETNAGLIIMLASAMGLASVGLSFVVAGEPDRLPSRPFWLYFLLILGWMLVIGIGFPLAFNQLDYTHMLDRYLNVLVGLVDISLLVFAVMVLKSALNKTWVITVTIAFTAPLLMTLSHWPYLLFPSINASQAYGATSSAYATMIGLIVSAPIIGLGLWLFVKLLKSESQAVNYDK